MTTPTTISALVEEAATRFGAAEAVVDGDRRVSFAELASLVRRCARGCLARGITPGDRVAVWGPNSLEWIVGALGALAAGGILVPLNTRFKGDEARYVLDKSGTSLVLMSPPFLGNDYAAMLGEGYASELLTSSLWDHEEATPHAGTPDDISDIIFTSGTTGRPKGVMCRHSQSIRVFDTWSSIVGVRDGDRYLVVNPFFHTFGYKAGILACLMRGATIVPQPVFDVDVVLQKIQDERITAIPGPPTLYQSILDHPKRDDYDLSSLRLAVTGAAVVPVELVKRMRDELSFETVLTAYGLTEATGTVTMCRPDDDPETIANTSGCAIPDTEVRVLAETGQPGEVVARGYNVMHGYFDDEAATKEAIDEDGWLHTGDVGVMDERGYVRITDRIKDMYVVGGFNAYPAEVELVIAQHPDVAEVAVVGVPDERLGEVGKAFVVTRADVDPDELIAWCRERMANYKVPRYVEFVDVLPRNASGKILKHELRSRA